MANLDTENKRRSALPLVPFTIPPVADGLTLSAYDRAQASYMYGGRTYGYPAHLIVTTFASAIFSFPKDMLDIDGWWEGNTHSSYSVDFKQEVL
jgi:hypothetical protein